MIDVPDAKLRSLIAEVQRRIYQIEDQGYTPWRVEIGAGWIETYGKPDSVLGLPVEVVPVRDYLRVAYKETWGEPPPVREHLG